MVLNFKKHLIKLMSGILLLCAGSVFAAEEKTTGYWQEMHNKTTINTGEQRTGQQVYKYKCYECHARNTQGAPMPGDNYEWNRRYQKGFDVLIKHSVEGFNRGLMPIRGGCRNCSDLELENAVIYMLNQSGVAVDIKDK